MARKSEHSKERTEVAALYPGEGPYPSLRGEVILGEGPTQVMRFVVRHVDFPELRFVVTFARNGVPIDFAIGSDLSPLEAPPITSRLLRRVPVGEIQEAARRHMSTNEHPFGWSASRVFGADWQDALADRPGRRGRGDLAYAQLAAQYVELCGTSPKPLALLEAQTDYSASQLRNLLYEARRRLLLTDSPVQGRAGGELTDKAKEILRGNS